MRTPHKVWVEVGVKGFLRYLIFVVACSPKFLGHFCFGCALAGWNDSDVAEFLSMLKSGTHMLTEEA